MPTISVFFGITIRMYFGDHGPPHFHAVYGESEAQIAIDTLDVLQALAASGAVPGLRTGGTNRDQLRVDWDLAVENRPLNRIPPHD